MAVTVHEQPPFGDEAQYWEGGAHFQAWYPLSVAAALVPGKIIGRDFLNTRVILYRDEEGAVVAQSAYCPHLGADLSDGEIVEGHVRCPYHHWRFDRAGSCAHIPSGIRPPRAAKLYNYPVVERWGLIWVFNGETPLYDPPGFEGSEDEFLYKVRERTKIIHSESWLQGTNGVDFQHLTAVHHMPPGEMPRDVNFGKYTIEYDFPLLFQGGKNRLCGPNCIVTINGIPVPFRTYAILATNAPRPGEAESFWVAAVKQEAGESKDEALARLEILDGFLEEFFSQDEYILNNIRLRKRGKAMLTKDDKYLAKYMNWLADFPRQRPFDI